jgi:hypothetical protein
MFKNNLSALKAYQIAAFKFSCLIQSHFYLTQIECTPTGEERLPQTLETDTIF